MSYFESACDAGHWLACVSLGRMYSRGIGVDADRTTAKQLYSRLAPGQYWKPLDGGWVKK